MIIRLIVAGFISLIIHLGIYYFVVPTDKVSMESEIKLSSEISLSVHHFNGVINDQPNTIQHEPLLPETPEQKKSTDQKPMIQSEKSLKKKKIAKIIEKTVPLEKQPTILTEQKKTDFHSELFRQSAVKSNNPLISKEDIVQSIQTHVSKTSKAEENKIISTKDGIPIVNNPGYLSKSPPVYPRRALQRKQEGKVVIDALLNREGNVKETEIFKSSGYKSLDQSALKAVKKWKFKPFDSELEYFQVLVRIPITFELKKGV